MVNIKEFGDRAFVNQQKYKTEKAAAIAPQLFRFYSCRHLY